MDKFDRSLREQPFQDYNEYMEYVFCCVNDCLDGYLTKMKKVFASEQGGYKNVLYPDIEVAHDVCKERISKFYYHGGDVAQEDEEFDFDFSSEEDLDEEDDELFSLLEGFSSMDEEEEEAEEQTRLQLPASERMDFLNARAELTLEKGIRLPFYELAKKLSFENFTTFCFACGILSSTQTDYAGIFQVINVNGNLSSPTIESAAKLYYGTDFSITSAFGDMSICLEQLEPILSLQVIGSMPFSTSVSPDKRIVDFLFGRNPMKLDENYIRFLKMLTDGKKLNPIMANSGQLEAMEISYMEGVRLFSYCGDEGSGRKFFIKQFCYKNGLKAISLNCKKLFVYDFSFVERAIWAVTRECILTNAVCVLEELQYREEEKEKFFGYMDLAFAKLSSMDITVFANSKDKIEFKEVTKEPITVLDLPSPGIEDRVRCWEYFAENYQLDDDCDLFEMSTKFLFTPGKIADALKYAKNLAAMEKKESIPRALLFKGCNAQMSSELSQKATRVEAKFGFDDIVMNEEQRITIQNAINQMNYKKQVYEDWNYTKKYPYGRGLTVLLFGAPGTGKSMMAQVLAHELNLELYRVDISKVVDKYVGETEKSLSMIFREAKKCNVVLFFDECDTIFAKRSDDGGSNQASANNKTALLLQEMEAYDGVCVLATNYKHNIDPAFFRRMKYIVEFEFPNVDTREMLWRTTVPKTTPLGDDVDFRFIAEKFEFAGGNIKNCILNAAFLAAADPTAEGEVCMRHYLMAIRYEFIKVGKIFTKADFEPYAEQIGL